MPPKASTSASTGAGAGASKKLSPDERKLIQVGERAPKGEIGQQELFAQAGLSINASTQDAVNSLLRKNLVQMLRTTSGAILFRFLKKEEAKAMGNMDSEEKLVLEHIKDAKNLGIWTKTLTTNTGLARATVSKALKVLEGRKAIKTVKSVKHPTRKIYMIAGIAPSVELTGGPWFTDNELDTELVDQLKMIALKFLQTKSIPSSVKVPDPSNPGGTTKFRPIFPVSATPFLPTVQDVLDYIVSLEVAVVELLPEHVEALLDLMVYDGVVEKVFVRRNEDEIDTLAAEANGKTKGKGSSSKSKGKGKASNGKGKRKTRGGSSDEDSDDSDDDSPKKKGKGKKGSAKRGANGKAKKKRAKLYNDDEEEESSESEDFNSDEEAPNKKKKKAVGKNGGKGGSDDEDGDAASSDEGDDSDGGRKTKGSSKRRKKRDRTKKKVKRSSSDDESSSSDVDVKKNGNGHTVDSDDEGGPKVDPGASQYVYRVIKPYEPVIGWTDMPCGRCPVEEFCSEPSRARAVAYKRPATVTEDSSGGGGGAPRMRIELEGGIQGVGMLGGAGAAIGVSLAKWGEMKGAVGTGVAPINPKDCPAFATWLTF